MVIGRSVIETGRDLVEYLLTMHQSELDSAYLKAEGALNVSLGLKFKPNETEGGVDVDASISFYTEKVKDSIMRTVDDKRPGLFDETKEGEDAGEGR